MKIFVTGADGFIGSHLCEALRDRGDEVTGLALYNSFDNHGWLDEVDGVTKVRGDVRDPGQIRSLIYGHDLVFHLAALISVPYSYGAPKSFIDTNVLGTLNVLEACILAEAKIVFASTSEIYGTVNEPITEAHPLNPQSPYAASKVAAEMLVRSYHLTYDLPCSVLRPFNTYGPRQSERALVATIIRQALDPECEEIRLGRFDTYRDLSYVDDTVRAFIAMGDMDEFAIYNSGTGMILSGDHIVNYVTGLIKTDKPISMDMAHIRPPDSEVGQLQADTTLLELATGWRPQWTFAEGVSKTIDWWRDRKLTNEWRYFV